MNRFLVLYIACISPLWAGIPSAKDVISPKSPIPAPSPVPIKAPDPLWNWFVGGSGGYLFDNEEGMWSGHLGIDLPGKLAGFDTSLFLEVSGAKFDTRFTPAGAAQINTDIRVNPITINGKLERHLFGPVNVYAGAGIGFAAFDLDYNSAGGTGGSDDEVSFYVHLFAGAVVNLTPSLEIFAGVRWLYFDEPDFDVAGNPLSLGDFDISNDDFLIEAGGRLNF